MENSSETVYSRHVVEFVAVANEFCKYAEHARSINGDEMLTIMQRLLPLLYLKGAFLPVFEPHFDDGNEKFVTESDWSHVKEAFRSRFASADDYLVLPRDKDKNEDPVPATISEDMADLYQDLKNFILLYQTGTEEVMNDAVWECRLNFEEFWGRKLLNAMSAIHEFIVSGEKITDLPELAGDDNKSKDDWFISRRQKESRERSGEKLS
ncbi:MAG: DUF5063 domain-containing protein [Bacteroidales bacterium]